MKTYYKIYQLTTCLIALIFCFPMHAEAQVLDDEGKVQIALTDGTQVTLFPRRASFGGSGKDFYYLPTNLKIGNRQDGTPEFLFAKYTTEDREDLGGINGAIMHFLMEWGLNPEQLNELEEKLDEKVRGAKVKGPVQMEADESNGSFGIVSATLSGDEANIITSGRAPLVQGGKAAVATKMNKNSAQLLASTFEKARSITDLSIVLNYNYKVQVPAIKGKLTIRWDKIATEVDRVVGEKKSKKNDFLGIFHWDTPLGYEETRSAYDYLNSNKYIELSIEQGNVSNEHVDKVIDAMFQYFTNRVSEISVDAEDMAASKLSSSDTLEIPENYYGKKFTFNKTSFTRRRTAETVNLENIRLTVTRSHQIVGNLASWYNQVRDNEKCVYSVNLNDPFYQHRDIRFVLDLEAKEMFDEGVNYVTVNVRKKRSSGNDFESHLTIDKKYIAENGITAVKTYARGEDTNPEIYEYQSQWSLRGGKIFPKNPRWVEGEWEGVTLQSPVTTRNVEFEANLEEMAENGFTRITAELRYKKFNDESRAVIHVSPAKGESLVEKRIFLDRDTKGYVYRLILNHKTEGKLVMPWEPRINDNYIYATIPEEMQDFESEIFQIAKEAGMEIAEKAKEKVIDKFDEIFEND